MIFYTIKESNEHSIEDVVFTSDDDSDIEGTINVTNQATEPVVEEQDYEQKNCFFGDNATDGGELVITISI